MHTTVTLCGSARFEQQFKEASKQLTLLGYIVIGLSSYPSENAGNKDWYDPAQKEILDLVHFAKVSAADVVLIIDGEPMFDDTTSHDPYIGYSTSREILWANMHSKPLISLLSASSWSDIAETIEHRYDENYFQGHSWIVNHAHQVLRTHAGTDQVKTLVNEGEKQVMHAALSVIASQGGQATSAFATAVLEQLQLDPHEDVMASLAGIPGFDGSLRVACETVVNRSVVGFNQTVDEDEMKARLRIADLMVPIEHRKLVGTIIMARAISDMLAVKPKLKRSEVIHKVDMMIETLYRSYNITRVEVSKALTDEDRGEDLFPQGDFNIGGNMADPSNG